MLFLGISILFVTQCKKESLAPDDSSELSSKVSNRAATISGGTFDFVATSPCSEDIKVKGTYQFVATDVSSTGGKVSFHMHLNAHGTGIGSKSGAKYKWADNWNQFFNYSLVNGQLHESAKFYTRMIGTGDAPEIKIILDFFLVLNANGDLVNKNGNFSIDCN